jgi:ankyrin repeat protein
VRLLLGHLDTDVKCLDDNGFTPLLKACSSLSYDAARVLLDNVEKDNLLLNHKDKSGNTVLHYTMEDGNLKLSIELIKLGAKTDILNNEGKYCLDNIQDHSLKGIILNYISTN